MNAYLTLIKIDVRLAFRQRIVLFFSYLMPFAFFIIFAQTFKANQGGAILQVVSMVTVLGIIGNGLFGAGIRAAQERDLNILRRYKVAPISPLPLLVASTVTGLVVYLPFVISMFILANARYGMALPKNFGQVMIFILLGLLATRALGLIVASVANSMQESGIMVQVIYMIMLFLSGATFPTALFPNWLLSVVQFIPSTWIMTGMQGLLLKNESLATNWQAVGAMILTTVLGLFLCVKLFRWEKEEKIRPAAKLWVLAVLFPFVVLGTWQTYSRDNVRKIKVLNRDLARSRTMLIRNARIFVGDGRVIENGAVLVKAGKIAEIYDGKIPDPKDVSAEPIEAAGKTVLPGLIDADVHLSGAGGYYDDHKEDKPGKALQRNLAAYLYSGVAAVRSAGDPLEEALAARAIVASGEKQGAELFVAGQIVASELLKSPGDAGPRVDAFKKAGVDAVEVALKVTGGPRLDQAALNAVAAKARADGLTLIAQTADERDVEDALHVRAAEVERGSMRQLIPGEDFAQMAKQGVIYDPALSLAEALRDLAAGKTELMNRPLVQQVAPHGLIDGTKAALTSSALEATRRGITQSGISLDMARGNLMRAYHAGVTLITGSGAGNPLVFHGPSVQRELELWVDAGIPAATALQAATLSAARALKADARIGSIVKGKDATMLVVDGNPLQDIKATEAISFVLIKGERVNRGDLGNGSDLLKQE